MQLRVWLDDWVIQLGDAIARGVKKSRMFVMRMSPDFFESEWEKLERH